MRLVTLLICTFAVLVDSWDCGVTPEWELENLNPESISITSTFTRSQDTDSIRILPFYVNVTHLMRPTQLRNVVVPSVLGWYKHILSVNRLEERLVLTQLKCGQNIEVPTEHLQTGVSEADFVLYITSISSEFDYTATAVVCALEGGNSKGNPVAAAVVLNGKGYNKLTLDEEIEVLKHEIGHALAISSFLFKRYRQPDGSLYFDPVTSGLARNQTIQFLTTPTVIQKAKLAFGCDSLLGLELESSGKGEVTSHWKKRMMFNDFMVRKSIPDVVYSDVTLAAFEDSGWYHVDFTYTDQIIYGKNKGCEFLLGNCITDASPNFDEFCVDPIQDMCTKSLSRRAVCDIRTYPSDLPSNFQWFSDPHIGGLDIETDYCPYASADLDGNCKGDGYTFINDEAYSEEMCESCMCFTGSYIKKNWANKKLSMHAGCHKVICEEGTAYVKLGKQLVECPVDGGVVESIEGFSGYIRCPSYLNLCQRNVCVHGCFGYGKCVLGVCSCDSGFSGVDCGISCHETCSSCIGSSASECTVCYPNASLKNNTCECDTGFLYSQEQHICVWNPTVCAATCLTCTGPGADQCVTCPIHSSKDLYNKCECDLGFARSEENATCYPCAETCKTCSGLEPDKCLSCFYHSSLPVETSVGACECDSGFYLGQHNLCSECALSCRKCIGETAADCTACKAEGAQLNKGSCVCPERYFLSIDGTACLSCHPTCGTCYGPMITHCTTCMKNAGLSPNHECKCDSGFQLSRDLEACLPIPEEESPCVTNYTALSTLLLLFFIGLLAARKLYETEIGDSTRNRPSVSTESLLTNDPTQKLTELSRFDSPKDESNPNETQQFSDSISLPPGIVNQQLPWSLRIGIFSTALIWGGFALSLIYFLASDDTSSTASARHLLSSFNVNDFCYILLVFLMTVSINYGLVTRYARSRNEEREEKKRRLKRGLSIALGICLIGVAGVGCISILECNETGGLWMLDFIVIFWLEIIISQLVLKCVYGNMLRSAR